ESGGRMHHEVERLVSLYDGGRITRRQLLQGLVAVGIGARVAPGASGLAPFRQAAPVFQAHSINHVTLYVSDVARSKAFYQSLTPMESACNSPMRSTSAEMSRRSRPRARRNCSRFHRWTCYVLLASPRSRSSTSSSRPPLVP